MAGIPINMASLAKTLAPQALKNFAAPIGDTFMGCQGKKYRSAEKGMKNPTPKPPDVQASSTP